MTLPLKYVIKTAFVILHMNYHNDQQQGAYEKAMAILKAAMERRYDVLTETFVKEGPDRLKELMAYENEQDWVELFDYLVSKQGVLKKTVMTYMDFFTDFVAKKGPQALRNLFRINESKYDLNFEEIFDLVAISTGALHNYVNDNKMELAHRIRDGKANSLRYELGLNNSKYDDLWFEILDLLMRCVCETAITKSQYDHGLKAFSLLMNKTRQQRSLRSYSKMWEYSDAGKF